MLQDSLRVMAICSLHGIAELDTCNCPEGDMLHVLLVLMHICLHSLAKHVFCRPGRAVVLQVLLQMMVV